MRLDNGDLEKIQKEASVTMCYKRIYDWHKKHGTAILGEQLLVKDTYSQHYSQILKALPIPKEATQADMDFVFGEVLSGFLEWSYHQEDKFGIKMAAYARFAVNKQYPAGNYKDFVASRQVSKLFTEFGDKSTGNQNL